LRRGQATMASMLQVSSATFADGPVRWPSPAAEQEPTHAAQQIRRASLESSHHSLAYLQQKREEEERRRALQAQQASSERRYRLSAEISRDRQLGRLGSCGNRVPMSLQKTGSVNVDFTWPHVGEDVSIIGSFSNWLTKIPLQKENGVWRTSLQLFPGSSYQYKFIVDGTWCFDSKQSTCQDSAGNTNNFVRL